DEHRVPVADGPLEPELAQERGLGRALESLEPLAARRLAVPVVVVGHRGVARAGRCSNAGVVLEAVGAAVERPDLYVAAPPRRAPHRVPGQLVEVRGAAQE